MLRSFNYAVVSKIKGAGTRPENLDGLKLWARFWNLWVSVNYLKGYFGVTRKSAFLPKTLVELKLILEVYLLEKAVYELGYELNNRPDWVSVPIEGILEYLGEGG